MEASPPDPTPKQSSLEPPIGAQVGDPIASKKRRGWTRRKALAALVGGSTLAGSGYSFGIEPNVMTVQRTSVPILPPGSQPVRILQLSDFHASLSTPLSRIDEAITDALALETDFCVFTGDFITQSLDEPKRYAKILRRISDVLPSWAILGNHDGGSGWSGTTGHCPPDHLAVDQLLRDSHIELLHNRSTLHRVRNTELMLVGTGDLWQEECDAKAAFGDRDRLLTEGASPAATVVLTHNPDARDEMKDHDWDLALTGHTHGGQVKVPFFGAPILPVNDRRFAEGLVKWEDRFIYVTRGVGSLLSIRFNCPPEITVIELVGKT